MAGCRIRTCDVIQKRSYSQMHEEKTKYIFDTNLAEHKFRTKRSIVVPFCRGPLAHWQANWTVFSEIIIFEDYCHILNVTEWVAAVTWGCRQNSMRGMVVFIATGAWRKRHTIWINRVRLWLHRVNHADNTDMSDIQGVPGGKDLTSGECSLGQTITI